MIPIRCALYRTHAKDVKDFPWLRHGALPYAACVVWDQAHNLPEKLLTCRPFHAILWASSGMQRAGNRDRDVLGSFFQPTHVFETNTGVATLYLSAAKPRLRQAALYLYGKGDIPGQGAPIPPGITTKHQVDTELDVSGELPPAMQNHPLRPGNLWKNLPL
jgi:hypothetical protein